MSSLDTGPGRGQQEERAGPARPDVPAPPPRALARPRDDRLIFGVAAGLGHYLGIDPVIVRVVFAVLALAGGAGVLLYLVAAVVMPEEDPAAGDRPRAHGGGDRAGGPAGADIGLLLGGALVVLGSMALLGRLLPAVSGLLGPVVLIAFGLALVLAGARR